MSKISNIQKEYNHFTESDIDKKLITVHNEIPNISNSAIRIALKSVDNDEFRAIEKLLTEPNFKNDCIRESLTGCEDAIKEQRDIARRPVQRRGKDEDFELQNDSGDDDYLSPYARNNHKRKKSERGDDSDGSHKKHRTVPRLTLNEALSKLDELDGDHSDNTVQKNQKGNKKLVKVSVEDLKRYKWSEARIKAYLNKDKNPNAYYYRFNDIGEPQATGAWTTEETNIFLNNIKQRGVTYEWGTFSRNIRGRVGYQCSNYYRTLIAKGEIEDENYYFVNGQLRFRFKGQQGDRKPKPKRPRGNYDSSDSENENDNEPETEDIANLLPDMIDPVTCTAMLQPAISPHGYVMDYQSWLQVLNKEPKNTCPFTKQKLTHRMLVKLTTENIEEYRAKINKDNKF